MSNEIVQKLLKGTHGANVQFSSAKDLKLHILIEIRL